VRHVTAAPSHLILRGGALASVGFACFLAACVGDDPARAPDADAGGDGGGGGGADVLTDAGVPPIAPDAAPAIGCPLGCLPPAPPGWTGPSATYDGPTATKPAACPPLYTQREIDAHQGLTAGATVCGCGTASFAGAKCAVAAVLYGAGGFACDPNVAVAATTDVPGAGSCLAKSVYSYINFEAPTLNRGTCTYPTPVKTLPAAAFAKENVACGLPQTGSCPDRADCTAVPVPDAPFARLCIHKQGEQSCPSLDYAARFLAHKSTSDTRACTPCVGATSGGACGTMFVFASDADCIVAAGTPVAANSACKTFNAYANLQTLGPSGIACTSAGGQATGAIASEDAVTFCCNK
jgi:hypothetical protein